MHWIKTSFAQFAIFSIMAPMCNIATSMYGRIQSKYEKFSYKNYSHYTLNCHPKSLVTAWLVLNLGKAHEKHVELYHLKKIIKNYQYCLWIHSRNLSFWILNFIWNQTISQYWNYFKLWFSQSQTLEST